MPYDSTMPYGMPPQGPQGPMPMQAPQVNPMMGMQRPRIPLPMPGQMPQGMPQGGQVPQGGQMMPRPMPPGGPGQINPQALAALMARLQGGQAGPMQNPGQMPMGPQGMPMGPQGMPMRPQMMPPQGPAPQMMPPQQQGPQGSPGALQSLLGVPNYSALQSRLRGVLGV